MTLDSISIRSPLGELHAYARGDALVAISLPDQPPPGDARRAATAVLALARAQLDAYFAGELRAFDLPLAPAGTEFQQLVWRALRAIPYGATRSYADIARAIDRPTASRAVGAANGKNPLAIVVPCHRVIGAAGALVGYAGGLPTKRWLLEHERGEQQLRFAAAPC
jgi:methylated-DNA-[protein]-cysteine S-methyltransferase